MTMSDTMIAGPFSCDRKGLGFASGPFYPAVPNFLSREFEHVGEGCPGNPWWAPRLPHAVYYPLSGA